MSQTLIPRINRENVLLFQDLYFSRKKTEVSSTVKEAVCAICEKILEDGVSITAKRIGPRMKFFCQNHLPKE